MKLCVNDMCPEYNRQIKKIESSKCTKFSRWHVDKCKRYITKKPESAWTRHQRLLLNEQYRRKWINYTECFDMPRTEKEANKRMDLIEAAIEKELEE